MSSSTKPIDVTVRRTIDAPADVIFDLVTDITRMHEWSPETTEARWLGDAATAAVGAQFAGTNRLGKNSWTTKPTITALEPGRLFEFKVPGKSGPIWRYEFRAAGEQTEVVESAVQAKRSPAIIRFFQRRAGVTDRAANLHQNMSTTLERLAVVAERART
jgi:uncharacterized protein YndB with AHSA1/START domain